MKAKKIFFLIISILFLGCFSSKSQVGNPEKTKKNQKPNVIFILTDDQGSIDVNSYGAKDLVTPNMNYIIENGVSFTQFYASPVCSPSRAALLTGKTPQRAGLSGNAVPNSKVKKGLPGKEYTMAEMFKDAGYATAHIGKWHLGDAPEMTPNAQGFDHSFGHMVGCIDNYSHFFYWSGPNRHDLFRNGKEVYYDGQFFPDLMVNEASNFIEENKKNPFFMYFAVNMPHYPYQGDAKWLAYYKDKGVPYPRNLYAAFISTLDERIGALLKKLDELGIKDNTIIVFQSDNGHSTEQRAHFGGGNAGPYRGAKSSLFEGGIRVPAAITWPNNIQKGAIRNQFGVNSDWMPTLAELCGIKLDQQDLDGKSLVDIINNEKEKTRHTEGYCWQYQDMWVARKGNWKLLGNPRDTGKKTYKLKEKRFLVNLDDDIGETINMAKKHPNKVIELEQQYRNWLKKNKN
jgi:arylsulfatase A-like enzyme